MAEVCGIIEYLNLSAADKETVIRVAPRFVVNDKGEYMVQPIYDADGDIEKLEFFDETLVAMRQVTPKRLEKLTKELSEAARAVVNPPKERG